MNWKLLSDETSYVRSRSVKKESRIVKHEHSENSLCLLEVNFVSFCCVRCFQDNYIRNKIFSNKRVGSCSYCGNKSQSVIAVEELTPEFEVVFSIYDRSQQGGHWEIIRPPSYEYDIDEVIFSNLRPLYQHIQNDWSIFF